ncbi:hypothetical protein LTR37_019046 [Vermiconidia calcicola]|uniref:Uncharacterized protein n=1 Tax=Vermiconidia calcicola TaxID=1690605 RepID=A0ACC3MF72_9PEZI|nr:hypothetical protein LTR37_019046 [Vermiconidia calcicola]
MTHEISTVQPVQSVRIWRPSTYEPTQNALFPSFRCDGDLDIQRVRRIDPILTTPDCKTVNSLAARKMDMKPDQDDTQHQAAASAVMNLPELLEHILLGLDFETLLLAQRVSTEWRDLISRSRSCQKKLFFAPVDNFEEAVALGMVPEDALVVFDEGSWYRKKDKASLTVLLNMHLLRCEEDVQTRGWCFPHLSRAVLPDTPSSRRGQSSWERMFLTQPPLRPEYANVAGADKVEKDAEPLQYNATECWLTEGWDAKIRGVMDEVEDEMLTLCGWTTAWTKTFFGIERYSYSYAEWKGLGLPGDA